MNVYTYWASWASCSKELLGTVEAVNILDPDEQFKSKTGKEPSKNGIACQIEFSKTNTKASL